MADILDPQSADHESANPQSMSPSAINPDAMNPMGTDGFEFVEYTAPDPQLLRNLFERLGFPVVARHRSKNVTLHSQGDINFVINAEADSFAPEVRPGAWAFGLRHGVPRAGCCRGLSSAPWRSAPSRIVAGRSMEFEHTGHRRHRWFAHLFRRPLR